MNDLQAQYDQYVAQAGDATPLDFDSWKASQGYGEVTAKKELSEEDRAYIAYTDKQGDGTPLSFADWVAAGKPAA